MSKLLVLNFREDDYKRKSEILTCNCRHPLCNGLYIKVKPDQQTCWWTYLETGDNQLLTDENMLY